jgi:hypothetical protein
MSDSGSTRQQIFDRIRGATPAAASVSFDILPFLKEGDSYRSG